MASFGANAITPSSGDGNDYTASAMNNGSPDVNMGSNPDQKSTIWYVVACIALLRLVMTDHDRMGELESWMDETYVKNVFRTMTNHEVQVKIIRDKTTG
jgi:hypothetical protein